MEKLIKEYICECGKVYTNPQSFNGHKSSCKVHFNAIGKDITRSSLYNVESQAKAHATVAKHYAEKREQRHLQWLAEKHCCERCGNVMTEFFGTGRFCSVSCANTRVHSKATKDKLAKAAKANSANRISSSADNIRVAKVNQLPVSILDISKRTISKVVLRMQLPCSCCGIYVPGVVWDIHHITPKHLGGKDTTDNLTYICPNCHRICHTDINLLPNDLVSIEDFLKAKNLDWKDYYFAKPTDM